MAPPTFAVLLSGCGFLDGAEIHEATLTLLAIHKNGAEFACFAPDVAQHHVINHLSGEETRESRNVLVEAARIARGNISALASYDPAQFDGLILPGGFGAAKNLSTFAFDGSAMTVNADVSKAILATHAAKKPIGALCIAPVILAKLLPGVKLTIGEDAGVAAHIADLGGQHTQTSHGEIVVDTANKVVSTPCYMLDSRVDQIAEGAEQLVRQLLLMAT